GKATRPQTPRLTPGLGGAHPGTGALARSARPCGLPGHALRNRAATPARRENGPPANGALSCDLRWRGRLLRGPPRSPRLPRSPRAERGSLTRHHTEALDEIWG